MSKACDAATILFHIIENQPSVDVTQDGEQIDLKGDFVFKGVNFNYPTRPDLKILQEFDLHIEAGKTTALVGPSGSGKSTVIQMLERFYNPKTGDITCDGRPIAGLNLRSYRR